LRQSILNPFQTIQSSFQSDSSANFSLILMDMFLDASKSAGMCFSSHRKTAAGSFLRCHFLILHDNFSAPPGYKRRSPVPDKTTKIPAAQAGVRDASVLCCCAVPLLDACGSSAAVSAWPDYLTQSSRLCWVMKPRKPILTDERGRVRKYFASNLSTPDGWRLASWARFHREHCQLPSGGVRPRHFNSTVAVLNDTVYCDAPAAEDSRLGVCRAHVDVQKYSPAPKSPCSFPFRMCPAVSETSGRPAFQRYATSSPLSRSLLHQPAPGRCTAAIPFVGDFGCGRLSERRNNVLLLCRADA
uniref:Myotubularin phosphatase domain-containing protein n=1 Tax=Macrostomum lignano TaxID=282301 RepID=A0A1I8JR84_9PLAT